VAVWRTKTEQVSHFLNVDLQIESSSDLQPLVAALGKRVIVLYVERRKRTYFARLELGIGKLTTNANPTIRGLCALIRALPKAERSLWTTAKKRSFDIGVQAGAAEGCSIPLDAKTVRDVVELAGEICFTVYGAKVREPRAQN
jgi:hypothetical protein